MIQIRYTWQFQAIYKNKNKKIREALLNKKYGTNFILFRKYSFLFPGDLAVYVLDTIQFELIPQLIDNRLGKEMGQSLFISFACIDDFYFWFTFYYGLNKNKTT
jgi:hypothetical protein